MSHRIAVAFAALLSALPVAVRAADEPPPPAAATILRLSERAERQVPRDELVLLLRVEATAKTAHDAQAEINRRMPAALDEAKKIASVKAETPAMNVFEVREPNKQPVWRATEALRLRSKDFTAALALLGRLEEQGLLVSALNFEVSRDALKSIEDALTAEALKRLQIRAAAIAAGMGLSIEHVRSVQIGEAGEPGPRPLMFAGIAARATASPPPTAEAGEAPVSVTVNAEIWLMPKR
ncbi:MAG TPA: SIMPL domain-containing protein [Stellaceae bacterium]|nr:SIMPL domain-containing protein [Stellaceae bacterium]